MNICQWESCIQSGCRICSQSIKYNASMIQSIVCNYFNTTKGSFWIHHFTSELNQQSAEWTAAGESRRKQPKMQTSAGKILASGFGDVQGILFINYLEKGRTINSEYYIALLVCLKEGIAKKRPQRKKKQCSFTKKMHHVTSRSQQWQNYMNCTSNCFHTHSILQI